MKKRVGVLALGVVVITSAPAGPLKENYAVVAGGVPAEIRQFLDRKSDCDRVQQGFRFNRLPSVPDQSQSTWLQLRCANLGATEADLRRRYRNNSAALTALEGSLFHRLTANI